MKKLKILDFLKFRILYTRYIKSLKALKKLEWFYGWNEEKQKWDF